MKKLVLALVCLVSVAFFASCNPKVENPEPSVGFFAGEGYISSDAEVLTSDTAWFCIQANSNVETKKLLKSFNFLVFSGDERQYDTLIQDINLNTYEFVTGFRFPTPGSYTVTGSVIDVDGCSAECRVNITVNQAEAPLAPVDITWVRRGSNCQNAEEMAQYGLKWEGRDAFHANIRPLNDDCKLYVIYDAAEAYNGITTDLQKAAFFSNQIETGSPVPEYRNISVASAGDKTYNDILAVIDAEGNQHLILFANANVQINTSSFGVQTTITGQVK